MPTGYVALLDILGFSAFIANDSNSQFVNRYLDCLQKALKGIPIESVIFSDSIVLTTKDDVPDSLIAIAEGCSRLMFELLNANIPIRGAISHGEFVRSSVDEKSVFVAGRAVIDAYKFEKKQDWIGIMVAPSALSEVPDLKNLCLLKNTDNPKDFTQDQTFRQEVEPRIKWASFIQKCFSIPFHTDNPSETSYFDSFREPSLRQKIIPLKSNPVSCFIK